MYWIVLSYKVLAFHNPPLTPDVRVCLTSTVPNVRECLFTVQYLMLGSFYKRYVRGCLTSTVPKVKECL